MKNKDTVLRGEGEIGSRRDNSSLSHSRPCLLFGSPWPTVWAPFSIIRNPQSRGPGSVSRTSGAQSLPVTVITQGCVGFRAQLAEWQEGGRGGGDKDSHCLLCWPGRGTGSWDNRLLLGASGGCRELHTMRSSRSRLGPVVWSATPAHLEKQGLPLLPISFPGIPQEERREPEADSALGKAAPANPVRPRGCARPFGSQAPWPRGSSAELCIFSQLHVPQLPTSETVTQKHRVDYFQSLA